MAGKRYTFVLNFGYVESSRLAYMPWNSNQTFKDAKEALLDLSKFLLDQFKRTNVAKLKKCCEISKQKDPEAKYCAKCANPLHETNFDEEDFIQWLRELDTDIDTFMGLGDWEANNRWDSKGLDGAPNQRFVYQAEWVISAAAGYPHSDKTFEDICKERTKTKVQSFTYY